MDDDVRDVPIVQCPVDRRCLPCIEEVSQSDNELAEEKSEPYLYNYGALGLGCKADKMVMTALPCTGSTHSLYV